MYYILGASENVWMYKICLKGANDLVREIRDIRMHINFGNKY